MKPLVPPNLKEGCIQQARDQKKKTLERGGPMDHAAELVVEELRAPRKTPLPAGVYVGIDEVGVSSIAGPMVAAAVILPCDHGIDRLPVDSKILKPEEIVELSRIIHERALAVLIASLPPRSVDEIGTKQSCHRLWGKLAARIYRLYPNPRIVLDGKYPIPGRPKGYVHPIPHADATHDCVSAAAIVAKAWCDAHMVGLAKVYAGFGFERNKGYPTRQHLEDIEKLGISAAHRPKMAAQAMNAEGEVEEADITNAALREMLTQAKEILDEHPGLIDAWNRDFLLARYKDVVERNSCPSLRVRYFVRRAFEALVKAARVQYVLPGAGLPADVPYDPRSLVMEWRKPLRVKTEDLPFWGRFLRSSIGDYVATLKTGPDENMRWYYETGIAALFTLLRRVIAYQGLGAESRAEAELAVSYLQTVHLYLCLAGFADTSRGEDSATARHYFSLIWDELGVSRMAAALDELVIQRFQKEKAGKLPPLPKGRIACEADDVVTRREEQMASKGPSPEQVAFLGSIGYKHPVSNSLEASIMLSRLTYRRKPA